MEEGPEPHEWIEKTVEHHEHEHEHSASASHQRMLAPITAAVLAVMAALGSLLSGHAVNEAILKQTKATDQWAYFQAKSTKGHIYKVSKEMLDALAAGSASSSTSKAASVSGNFEKQVHKYDTEKEQLEHEARHLEEESEHEFHKHHQYAFGIASFQVGIVLASISIMVRYRPLYLLSLVSGAIGIIFVVLGLIA